MQIDFKALEQALAPIEEIGQGELTFDAGGTPITLRILLPAEEVEAQKFAAEALNEAGEGEHSAVDYLDRFRIGCLAHAVIAVGELDFRGAAFIETGEKLDNGTPIKLTKSKAMRTLLARWTRPTLTAVFGKFNELVQRTEQEAEKLIEFEPASVSAEMDRLHKRLEELREQQQQTEAAEQARFSDKVSALATSDAEGVQVAPDAPAEASDPDEPKVNPEQVMPVVQRTGPVSPQQAPPPPERKGSPPLRPTPEQPLHRAALQQPDSSFINPDDEDGLNAALDAEHNRIAAMRRRAAMGEAQPDEGSGLQQIHPQMGGRRPPHLDAREAEEEVGVLEGTREVARATELEGTPVLDLPAQDLGVQAPPKPGGRVTVNPAKESGGSLNPRFTPRKQP